jgi:zinc/manganese transport system substrate-binding protein
MRKIIFLVILFLCAASPALAKMKVVATLQWIGSVAGDIGGDQVEITALVKPTQDPHMIEAKPSMVLAVRKADILLYNGLDLEIGYLPVLIESSRNPKVQPGQPGNFDCSRFVDVIEKPVSVDRSMGDVHPLGNPHYQYSATAIQRIAEGIARQFSRLDPANAALYNGNLATFQRKVMEKRKQWESVPLKEKRFIAFHKYFEYLAAAYGFQITGYVEPKPGIPPSAGYLEHLIETIRRTEPDGILVTPYYGIREVRFLSEKTGIRSIVIPQDVGATPGAGDWFSMMDQVITALAR